MDISRIGNEYKSSTGSGTDASQKLDRVIKETCEAIDAIQKANRREHTPAELRTYLCVGVVTVSILTALAIRILFSE